MSSNGKPKKKNYVGRPVVQRDEDQIFRLAQIGLTDDEIQHCLDLSNCVLEKYRAIIQRGRANLSKSIKRTQLELALKHKDRQMLIWVGKQYAGQRETLDNNFRISTSPEVVVYGEDVTPYEKPLKKLKRTQIIEQLDDYGER